MNTKITLVELIDILAESTSTSKRMCELFLRELFSTVSQELINGETVKIKNIGTFKVTQVKPRKSVNVVDGEDIEISGHKKITFTPDKSLAEAVNQPFAQFESVVLDDALTDEKLAAIDEKYPSVAFDSPVEEAPAAPTIEEAPAPAIEDVPAAPARPVSPEPPVSPVSPEPPVTPVDNPPIERKPMLVGIPIDGPSHPVPEPVQEEVVPDRHFYRPEPRNIYTPTPEQIEEASHKPNRRWLWPLLGLVAAAALAWLLMWGLNKQSVEKHDQEIVMADTIVGDDLDTIGEKLATTAKPKPEIEAKAEPKQEPKVEAKQEPKAEEKPAQVNQATQGERTDVITRQEVLTTMAQKYYGSQWFWVYIYEENKNRGIINDPNNIRPGTRVVIPPAEKYGINPNDKASLKKAQIKSMELLR